MTPSCASTSSSRKPRSSKIGFSEKFEAPCLWWGVLLFGARRRLWRPPGSIKTPSSLRGRLGRGKATSSAPPKINPACGVRGFSCSLNWLAGPSGMSKRPLCPFGPAVPTEPRSCGGPERDRRVAWWKRPRAFPMTGNYSPRPKTQAFLGIPGAQCALIMKR